AQFVWYNSSGITIANTQNTVVSQPGKYYLRVVNPVFSTCDALDSVNVVVDTLKPSVTCTPGQAITCSVLNSNLTGSATAAVSINNANNIRGYSWSNNGTSAGNTPAISVNNASPYTLTVTQSNGCTATTTCNVAIDTCRPSISVTNNGPITCSNPSPSVTSGAVACLGSTLKYLWSNGNTSANLSTSIPGTYAVTVTQDQNGCSVSGSTQLAIDTCRPSVSASNSGTVTCVNPLSTVIASATTCPGKAIAYSWSSGQTLSSFTTNQLGSYTVTITQTGNGCTASSTTSVAVDTCRPAVLATTNGPITCTNPTPTVQAIATVCFGQTPSYAWSNGSTNQSFTTANDTSYTVTVSQSGNGCTASSTVGLLSNNSAPTVSCSPLDSIRCNDATAALEVTALPTTGNTIIGQTWLPGGATTPTITVND
ncbi:MAG: hypothetical protein ACKOQ6_03950, partial [Bacteroidota bacterium]